MEREEALALLRLDPDADLEAAEQVYYNLKTNISQRLDQLPADSSYRGQLEEALAGFDAAIDCMRNWHAGQSAVEEAPEPVPEDWWEGDSEAAPAVTAQSSPEPEEDDARKTQVVPRIRPDDTEVQPPPQFEPEEDDSRKTQVRPRVDRDEVEEEQASAPAPEPEQAPPSIPARGGLAELLSKLPWPPPIPAWPAVEAKLKTREGILGIVGALILIVVLIFIGDEPEPEAVMSPVTDAAQPRPIPQQAPDPTPEPEPAPPTTPVPEDTAVQDRLLASWRQARDSLMDRQLELRLLLDEARDERLELIRRHIADEAYLARLGELAFSEPPVAASVSELSRSKTAIDEIVTDAEIRLANVSAMDEALAARGELSAQVAVLETRGLPFPPADSTRASAMLVDVSPDALEMLAALQATAEENLRAGDFLSAGTEYQQATAALAALQFQPREATTDRVAELYESGLAAISRLRLTRPLEGSALDFAQRIEALDAARPEAAELRRRIQQQYLILSRKALDKDNINKAQRNAELAVVVAGESHEINRLTDAIARRKRQLEETRFKPLQPSVEFDNLVVVTLPTGQFEMGASRITFGRLGSFLGLVGDNSLQPEMTEKNDETPVHTVKITDPVAFGRTEVTVGQFRRFIEDTGFVTDAEQNRQTTAYFSDVEIKVDRNWREDYLGNPAAANMPVLYVSHRDATAYAQWLSEQTGASYRLPSESEFEYAARAGEQVSTPWGRGTPPDDAGNFRGQDDDPPYGWENVKGARAVRTVKKYGDGYFGPAPVGSFAANAYGLEDMLGNVSEWVGDCHTPDYEGKGESQAAVDSGDCRYQMVRGGDWGSDARNLRFTYREGRPTNFSSNRIGFRVVRDVGTDP